MSSDDDRSAQDIEQQMGDEAGRMQRDLDELGEHVKEARKKADDVRVDTDLPGDEAVETAAPEASDRSTSSDDPASAVGDPGDDEDGDGDKAEGEDESG